MGHRLVPLLLVCALLPAPSLAQTGDERYFEEAGDDDRPWRLFGDLRVRGDYVDLPARDDFDRLLSFLRIGVRFQATAGLELGASLTGAAGTSDFDLSIPLFDNEDIRGVRLDRAFVRWRPTAEGELLVGQEQLPLWLSEMVWDRDLRPAGISYDQWWTLGRHSLRFVAGAFAGNHRYGEGSRIAAAQLGWRVGEDEPSGFEAFVSYLEFDDLEDLVAVGLGRQNRVTQPVDMYGEPRARTYVSDYELVDLQVALRRDFVPAHPKALTLRLDYVRNLGADDQDEGTRFEAIWGELEVNRWELGFAAERIERDAVLGAFNSDDWWNHSWFRGQLGWLAINFTPRLDGRVSAFVERRDDRDRHLARFLLDFTWRI